MIDSYNVLQLETYSVPKSVQEQKTNYILIKQHLRDSGDITTEETKYVSNEVFPRGIKREGSFSVEQGFT